MNTNENHAETNAAGWADTIIELYTAYTDITEGEEKVVFDGDEYDDEDAINERAQEMPLSVQVRSDWYTPGTDNHGPSEYEILLTTGGPALRITGDLYDGEPDGPAKFQYRDWGTAWERYDSEHEDWDSALEWFVSCFYFGE